MTLTKIQNSFKGASQIQIRRLTGDRRLFNLPTPANITLNDGVEQRELEGRNDQGEMTRQINFPITRKGSGTVTFSHMQMEILAMKQGVLLASTTYDAMLPMRIEAVQGEFTGKASGYFGNGIVADAGYNDPDNPAVGYMTENYQSAPLTQEQYANYNTWRTSTKRFAIGADGAIRLSDDLVTAREIVSLQVPYTVTSMSIGDEPLGPVEIRGLVVDSNNQVKLLIVYSASVDLANAGMDMGADSLEVNFFLNQSISACRLWNIYAPTSNNQVRCLVA